MTAPVVRALTSGQARCAWLVLGASGFVGSALVEHLRRLGQPVRGISAPRLSSHSSADVLTLAGAATVHGVRATLRDKMADVERVVIAAGAATPDANWSAEMIGANSLLPAVVALAAQDAGVRLVIHLSSAAVQGRTSILTESPEVTPFSAYSQSKAIGEQVLQSISTRPGTTISIVRATSVQGAGRVTTTNLRRIAGSRLASVAGTGDQPSAVSSVGALCQFITALGLSQGSPPPIALQPWEGLSVAEVLTAAGGHAPLHLPRSLCSATVNLGYAVSRIGGGRWAASVRRLEAMWFGQEVRAEWARLNSIQITPEVRTLLEGVPR